MALIRCKTAKCDFKIQYRTTKLVNSETLNWLLVAEAKCQSATWKNCEQRTSCPQSHRERAQRAMQFARIPSILHMLRHTLQPALSLTLTVSAA